jgi:UDP-N-acetylmuramate: L-alanyl-gamma-D-glutamyl-meso-diaminopimelate ligase
MHIFIVGICGTFMAGIALMAREMGIHVRGCDANVYPPMSEQLRAAGIEVLQGYAPSHLDERPDVVVIGNALSRGNALVEAVLNQGMPYTSGPQWLWENVLHRRHVVAVSGTHGKTTTTSMLAWIFEQAGESPGFLIGGIPADFGVSARLGRSDFFIIEADEYDTAFFDKRSKFVHYRPRTLIINNIEFDHADIFPDLAAIERQFHHLVRVVPANGSIVYPYGDAAVGRVLGMGLWSDSFSFGIGEHQADWRARLSRSDGAEFTVHAADGSDAGLVRWRHSGLHNVNNATAAMAAASRLGIPCAVAARALSGFAGVRRRMECLGTVAGVTVYDDFAHHPTAIATTLEGLRRTNAGGRIIAVIEPRSNTMRLGAHRARLPGATQDADLVLWFQPQGVDWDMQSVAANSAVPSSVHSSTQEIIETLVTGRQDGDRIVIMSNGGFETIHQRLLQALDKVQG